MPQRRGQKSIGGKQPPRVQIEFDDETHGSPKKVELPLVVGVMADLVGKPAKPLPSVKGREFLPIDIEDFDARLKALRPRVAFTVPNVLSSKEGNIPIEMTFESMGDFTPDGVVRKVEAMRKLLEVRERLSRLLTYMDGRDSAEKLVDDLLKEAQQGAQTAPPKPADAGG